MAWPALGVAAGLAGALRGSRARRMRGRGVVLLVFSKSNTFKKPAGFPAAKERTQPGELPGGQVEVVSYNVLCSHLSLPSYYWHNSPEDLHPPTRLQRVIQKLEAPVQRGAVICLQECSMLWSGFLHTFFQRKGYHFVVSQYGRQFQGYMGVGIAFPTWRYEATAITIQRVAEGKSWSAAREEVPVGNASGLTRELLDLAGYFASPHLFVQHHGAKDDEDTDEDEEQPAVDPWEYSRMRLNTMVAVKLRDRRTEGKPFTVATYHMPCAFWSPKVMVIHTALAAQCACRFSGEHPLILAGDWNFKPGAAPYQLLTTGELPQDHPAHPGYPEGEEWRLEFGLQRFRSAYAERNPGGEPQFTNYAWVRHDIDPFIGTIDYIFVSEKTEVLSVSKLPDMRECASPLPTRAEPSDHLLLSARLRPYGEAGREGGARQQRRFGSLRSNAAWGRAG